MRTQKPSSFPPNVRRTSEERFSRRTAAVQVTLLAASAVAAFLFLSGAFNRAPAPPVQVVESERSTAPAQRVPVPALTVYFAPDDPRLTTETRRRLDEWLELLDAGRDQRIAIVGHCAIAGSEQGRLKLSLDRATNVARYLRENGLPGAVAVEILGMGARQPVTFDRELQHLNRRVDVVPR